MMQDNKLYLINTANICSYYNSLNYFRFDERNKSIISTFVGEQIKTIEEDDYCSFKVTPAIEYPPPFIMQNPQFSIVQQNNIYVQPACRWNDVIKLPGPTLTVKFGNAIMTLGNLKLNPPKFDKLSLKPTQLENGHYTTNFIPAFREKQISRNLFKHPGICSNPNNIRLVIGNNDLDNEVIDLRPSNFKRPRERRYTPYTVRANQSMKEILEQTVDPLQSINPILDDSLLDLGNITNPFSKINSAEFDSSRMYRFNQPNPVQWVETSAFVRDVSKYKQQGIKNVLPYVAQQGKKLMIYERTLVNGDTVTGAELKNIYPPRIQDYFIKNKIFV